MTAHSPGPNLAYMQSHPDSSPFAAMSPAAANWPGSPRPSPRPGQSPEHKIQPQGIKNTFFNQESQELAEICFIVYRKCTAYLESDTGTFMGRSCTNAIDT